MIVNPNTFCRDIVQKYPYFFREIDVENGIFIIPNEFEINCTSGWFPLIAALCTELKHSVTGKKVEDYPYFESIAESVGRLRIRLVNASNEQLTLVKLVETMSTYMCEYCGSTTDTEFVHQSGFLVTVCPTHRKPDATVVNSAKDFIRGSAK